MTARRQFLRLLAGSPVLACSGLTLAAVERLFASGQLDDLIATPEQGINVLHFEPVARRKRPPAHFGYLATGVDDDATVRDCDVTRTRLAELVDTKLATAEPGSPIQIREEFAPASPYSLVLDVRADGFDPASADRERLGAATERKPQPKQS